MGAPHSVLGLEHRAVLDAESVLRRRVFLLPKPRANPPPAATIAAGPSHRGYVFHCLPSDLHLGKAAHRWPYRPLVQRTGRL